MVGLETVAPALPCGSQLHSQPLFNREPLDISLQFEGKKKTLTISTTAHTRNLTVFDHFVLHDFHCPTCMSMLMLMYSTHTQDLLCSLLKSREPVGRPDHFLSPCPWTCLLRLRSAVATCDTSYLHVRAPTICTGTLCVRYLLPRCGFLLGWGGNTCNNAWSPIRESMSNGHLYMNPPPK